MPLTSLQVCNRSLLLLGANKVTAIDGSDTSYNALLCQELYSLKREIWLTEYPWRFNMRKVELAENGTAPKNEWTRRFDLPTNGITNEPHAVFNSDQVGCMALPATFAWEIFETYLHTNETEIWIDYQVDIDEASWPVWFVDFCVADLCAELAFPVTDQNNTAEYWRAKARGNPSEDGEGGLKGMATFKNSQLNGVGLVASDELLAVRY
jgi:hypothetical protein